MKSLTSFISCAVFLVFGFNISSGQTASVKFEVKVPSGNSGKDTSVFLTGSFNCWNPNDSLYIMQESGDNLYSIIIPVFDGKKYEYKYTLGSWKSVETSSGGKEIKNRQLVSHDGLVIRDTVLNWKSPEPGKQEDTTLKLSKKQLEEISKLKEEMGKKMEAKVKGAAGLLKKAIENMLSEKPDMKLRKKYHNEIVKDINFALDIAGDAMWKASSKLSPEQKKALLNELNKPDESGDIFGLMKKAMTLPGK
jgi:hypothetical protein